MSIVVPTGLFKRRHCGVCRLTVSHEKCRTADGVYWSCQPHLAPCGAPCFGGGIRTDAERSSAHGYLDHPCPSCGFINSRTVYEQLEPDGVTWIRINERITDGVLQIVLEREGPDSSRTALGKFVGVSDTQKSIELARRYLQQIDARRT